MHLENAIPNDSKVVMKDSMAMVNSECKIQFFNRLKKSFRLLRDTGIL